jgi:hypothetical protein
MESHSASCHCCVPIGGIWRTVRGKRLKIKEEKIPKVIFLNADGLEVFGVTPFIIMQIGGLSVSERGPRITGKKGSSVCCKLLHPVSMLLVSVAIFPPVTVSIAGIPKLFPGSHCTARQRSETVSMAAGRSEVEPISHLGNFIEEEELNVH